jgi:hypothetical protein
MASFAHLFGISQKRLSALFVLKLSKEKKQAKVIKNKKGQEKSFLKLSLSFLRIPNQTISRLKALL